MLPAMMCTLHAHVQDVASSNENSGDLTGEVTGTVATMKICFRERVHQA